MHCPPVILFFFPHRLLFLFFLILGNNFLWFFFKYWYFFFVDQSRSFKCNRQQMSQVIIMKNTWKNAIVPQMEVWVVFWGVIFFCKQQTVERKLGLNPCFNKPFKLSRICFLIFILKNNRQQVKSFFFLILYNQNKTWTIFFFSMTVVDIFI